MSESLNVVRGTNNKPVATDVLVQSLRRQNIPGELLIGYPIMASREGNYAIDALLISPQIGLVCFDIVEGVQLGEFQIRQDDAYNKLQSRLLTHRGLVQRRALSIPINVASFAPTISDSSNEEDYPLIDEGSLPSWISTLGWRNHAFHIYEQALSAIHNMSAIRRPSRARHLKTTTSKGAKLAAIENSISTLDRLQSKAVIETVDGVQRIRGLAGSGKTVVLALKAAYLHARHPDWRIAVTFHTRSLKPFFIKLINNFSIEQTGEEPDWEYLRVINSWGAPGAPDRDGIYHEFCRYHGVEYLDFNSARYRYGMHTAFDGAVTAALSTVTDPQPLYNAILVDEAQDFSPAFLKLCYDILHEPRRLVYAYDELQNLTRSSLPPVETIFGTVNGNPRVTFHSDTDHTEGSRDIILEKCYRNSREALVTAHGLGFGIYRDPPSDDTTGLVQMFDQPELWKDIGYQLSEGTLALGQSVSLKRPNDTSPLFLSDHSPVDELVRFIPFDDEIAQAQWVTAQIEQDLTSGELRHNDIMVINTDPVVAREKLGIVRKALLERGIHSHIAGVDTSPDIFSSTKSITCTGIFRAKGNEAAMVYVINGQECHSNAGNLSRLRNRLFTAITRSKAWVTVTGIGDGMQQLMVEYRRIKCQDFRLKFRYPTQQELDKLTIVHRDMSADEAKAIERYRRSVSDVVRNLREGQLFLEDLDADDLIALRELMTELEG